MHQKLHELLQRIQAQQYGIALSKQAGEATRARIERETTYYRDWKGELHARPSVDPTPGSGLVPTVELAPVDAEPTPAPELPIEPLPESHPLMQELRALQAQLALGEKVVEQLRHPRPPEPIPLRAVTPEEQFMTALLVDSRKIEAAEGPEAAMRFRERLMASPQGQKHRKTLQQQAADKCGIGKGGFSTSATSQPSTRRHGVEPKKTAPTGPQAILEMRKQLGLAD